MVPYWHFSHWAITVIARKALFARRRNLIERVIRLLHPYGVRNDKITVLYGQATHSETGKNDEESSENDEAGLETGENKAL